MRNFVYLFGEKEGSTAIIRLLGQFKGVHVVRQGGRGGWEPFNTHECGAMRLGDQLDCVEAILGQRPLDMARVNALYAPSAKAPLADIDTSGSVGFKMRFRPPDLALPFIGQHPLVQKYLMPRYQGFQIRAGSFRRRMFNSFRRHRPVVFVAVRQDLMRWGLSRYHGDGTGKKGHLQFKLQTGAIQREDIAPIRVDIARLEYVIGRCESNHRRRRRLFDDLRAAGITAVPLLYERFATDRARFVRDALAHLETGTTEAEIQSVLARPEDIQRVHSEDIAEFVVNHEEVREHFEGRFVSWEGLGDAPPRSAQ